MFFSTPFQGGKIKRISFKLFHFLYLIKIQEVSNQYFLAFRTNILKSAPHTHDRVKLSGFLKSYTNSHLEGSDVSKSHSHVNENNVLEYKIVLIQVAFHSITTSANFGRVLVCTENGNAARGGGRVKQL